VIGRLSEYSAVYKVILYYCKKVNIYDKKSSKYQFISTYTDIIFDGLKYRGGKNNMSNKPGGL
jgi:hypothetical protein